MHLHFGIDNYASFDPYTVFFLAARLLPFQFLMEKLVGQRWPRGL